MIQTQFTVVGEIAAPPAQVWSVMADVERWPEWTSSISRIKHLSPGPLQIGSRVRVHQPKLPPAFWRVTALNPGEGFTWVSRAPGVRVTARHTIEAVGLGSRVTLSIQYEGLLGRWLARWTRHLNERYLAMEANGLKARCTELAAHRTDAIAEVSSRSTPVAAGESGGGRYLGLLAVWLGVAVMAGALGWVERMRPPWPQVVLLGLTAMMWRFSRNWKK